MSLVDDTQRAAGDYPKYDIHRHLGGSISVQTVWKIINRLKFYHLAKSLNDVRKLMTYISGDRRNFRTFLRKFEILDGITWKDWAIELVAEQVCRDMADEHIKYAEISLSLNKFVKHNNWTINEAASFISDSFKRHAANSHVEVGLLLSLRYDSPRELQNEFSAIIFDDEIASKFVGLDLVGAEEFLDVDFYEPIVQDWNSAGKRTRAHVGELPGTCKNVQNVVECLKVSRIAHGIQASREVLRMCVGNNISFDLALHSNLFTGDVKSIREHHLKTMVHTGCKITLNTDDPVQFGCRLEDEYRLAVDSGLVREQDVVGFRRNAHEVYVNSPL